MSGHYRTAVMFVFLVAIVMAAFRAENSNLTTQSSSRQPASLGVIGKKLPPVFTDSIAFPRHTEKLRGPLTASIELVGGLPNQVGDVFALRATLTAADDLRDVDYHWSLPDGVEVVSGNVKGRLSDVYADQPAMIEVTLKTTTGNNHQVSLIAGASKDGNLFADSVVFNTLLESELAKSRSELAKSTKRDAAKQVAKDQKLKIFH